MAISQNFCSIFRSSRMPPTSTGHWLRAIRIVRLFAQRFNDTHLTNALKSPFCFPICVSQFRSTGSFPTATFHTTISLLIAVFSFLTPLAFVRFTYPHCVLLEQRFSELFLSIKGNNLIVGNRIQFEVNSRNST